MRGVWLFGDFVAETVFLLIGAVGLGIVLISLLVGEVLEGVFDFLDADVGGGLLSGPVIGSFLAAFGFGAALVMYSTGIGAAGGALSGLGSGIVVGGIAGFMTHSLMNMPTDASVRTTDLVGKHGVVVTPIREGRLGEITLTHLGQLQKLSARCDEAVAAGEQVTVVAVASSSSVIVRRGTGPTPQT